MKRFIPAAEPIPRKFAAGDRVKPTAEAISWGWTKPGVAEQCGIYVVAVLMDGELESHQYSVDYWELE